MPVFVSQDVDGAVNEPLIGWQNLFLDRIQGVEDLDSPTTHPRRNALNGLTYNFWRVNVGNNPLTVDMGSSRSVDYIGIAAHTLGSTGQGVKVERSGDGSGWTRAHSEEWFAPSTDAPLMVYFPRQSFRR